jgi:hypothetical protein
MISRYWWFWLGTVVIRFVVWYHFSQLAHVCGHDHSFRMLKCPGCLKGMSFIKQYYRSVTFVSYVRLCVYSFSFTHSSTTQLGPISRPLCCFAPLSIINEYCLTWYKIFVLLRLDGLQHSTHDPGYLSWMKSISQDLDHVQCDMDGSGSHINRTVSHQHYTLDTLNAKHVYKCSVFNSSVLIDSGHFSVCNIFKLKQCCNFTCLPDDGKAMSKYTES